MFSLELFFRSNFKNYCFLVFRSLFFRFKDRTPAAIAHFPSFGCPPPFYGPSFSSEASSSLPLALGQGETRSHTRDLSDLPNKISPPRPRMKKKRRRRRENENYLRPSRSSSSQKGGGGGLLLRIKKCNEDLFTIGSITLAFVYLREGPPN